MYVSRKEVSSLMSSRKVVHDSLSIKTTEHDDEEVPNIDELQEVCSGVVITNCYALCNMSMDFGNRLPAAPSTNGKSV